MQSLKASIEREQPLISQAIQSCIDELPPLSKPVALHIFEAGGKRLRPLLTLWTGRLFGCPPKELYTLGAAIEILHTATLLHDDILDNADLRRGKPTAHTQFSSTHVILAGDALLAKALMTVASYGDERLTFSISEAVLQTAEGQIAELANLRNLNLSYPEYISIITGKTAWLLKTSCELGALYAKATPEQVAAISTFGLELGIAFQLVDDALDFSVPEETGKPSGGDLIEGKITPPFLLYLDSLPTHERECLTSLFTSGGITEKTVTPLCESIRNQGFAALTRDMAVVHVSKALDALLPLPETDEKAYLKQLARYILTRSK